MDKPIYGIPVGGGGGGDSSQSDWNQTDETQNDYIKNKPENLAYINPTDNEDIEDVDDGGAVLYIPQTLTDVQKKQVCQNIGIPAVTAADAGKFMRVSSNGEWVVETMLNAEEVSF